MPGVLKARTAVSPDVWKAIGGGITGVLVPNVNVINNTGTWTKPNGLVYADVEVQGGGGASGGAPASTTGNVSFGSSGSAGGYARKMLLASQLNATEAVYVGAGGAGVSGASGNPGGNSQFGDGTSQFTAIIGNGGFQGTAVVAGAVGTTRWIAATGGALSSGGDVNARGGTSGPFIHLGTGSIGGDAGGGMSAFGAGATYTLEANGNAATSPGSGGGGMRNSGVQVARIGGAGAKGVVIVTEWTQQVAATGVTAAYVADRTTKLFSANGIALSAQAVTTLTTTVTLNVPAQPIDGFLYVSMMMRFDKTVATDAHNPQIYDGGSVLADWYSGVGTPNVAACITASVAAPANTARTLTGRIIRLSGTGTISTFSTYTNHHLEAIWMPA